MCEVPADMGFSSLRIKEVVNMRTVRDPITEQNAKRNAELLERDERAAKVGRGQLHQ